MLLPTLLLLRRYLCIPVLAVEEPYEAEGQDDRTEDDQDQADDVHDGYCCLHGNIHHQLDLDDTLKHLCNNSNFSGTVYSSMIEVLDTPHQCFTHYNVKLP